MAGLLMGAALQAQNYSTSQTIGAPAAYNVEQDDVDVIMEAPADEVLSSWQTLPFTWTFYGQAVTGYYISDNGYITFDQAATTSHANNGFVPNPAGPNNAIYAFWDNIELSSSGMGAADQIVTWTYGEEGYRTHVIQWRDVSPVGGSASLYFSILIYECGDFDVMMNWGYIVGMTGTIGCENAAGNAGQGLWGAPSLPFPDLTDDADDDITNKFFYDGIEYDASIVNTNFYGTVPIGNNDFVVTIRNNGGQTIETVKINYSINGGATQTEVLTGFNLTTGFTDFRTISTTLDIPVVAEEYELCIWIGDVNGQTDQRSCNDMYCQTLFAVNGTTTPKKVLFEKFTGTWCPYCIDGAITMDDILNANPNDVVASAIHSGDVMEANTGIEDTYVPSGYPNGMVDRHYFPSEGSIVHGRGSWQANAQDRLNVSAFVEPIVTHTYDPATRTINGKVYANFVDYARGAYRVNLLITEDEVTGGSAYDQANAYNSQQGHPYYQAGSSVAGFVHKHVLRAAPLGVFGEQLNLPSIINPNDLYSVDFSYTLPADWDENNIYLIGFVSEYDEMDLKGNEVINVREYALGESPSSVGIEDELPHEMLGVYPNPVNGTGYVVMSFGEMTKASFEIYNTMGQKVATLKKGNFTPGEHTVYFSTENVTPGVYQLVVSTDHGTYTNKIIVTE